MITGIAVPANNRLRQTVVNKVLRHSRQRVGSGSPLVLSFAARGTLAIREGEVACL